MARSLGSNRFILVLLVGMMLCPVGTSAQDKAPADIYGDPLPEGAFARLGTVRFRHGPLAQVVAYAPKGHVLGSSNIRTGAWLWDRRTGLLLHRLIDDQAPAGRRTSGSLAFSPDGTKVCTNLCLFDVATGKMSVRLKAQPEEAFGGWNADFSRDGSLVATGGHGGDGHLIVWDAKTGEAVCRTKAPGKQGGNSWVAFSPADDKVFASADIDKTIRLWDAATGKQLHRLDGHTEFPECVAFSMDGKFLVSGGHDGVLRFWDVKSGKPTDTIKAPHDVVNVIAFTPNGKQFVSTGEGGAICVWDVQTRKEVRRWQTQSDRVAGLAVAADGKTVATVSSTAIQQWEFATGKEINAADRHGGSVSSIHFAPGGKTLFSCGDDRKVIEWDLAFSRSTGRLRPPAPGTAKFGFFRQADISSDGKTLAHSYLKIVDEAKDEYTSMIRLSDTQTGKEIGVIDAHAGILRSHCFSPDGKRLASAGQDGIRLWDVASAKQLHHFAVNVQMFGLVFAPDGQWLGAFSREGQIRQWETATGKEGRKRPGDSAAGFPFCYSPDGKLIAAYTGELIHLQAADTGKNLVSIKLTIGVSALAFSPNGRLLAAAGSLDRDNPNDELVARFQLFEVRTGEEIRAYTTPQSNLSSLAFAPDGGALATGGRDSTIILWDLTGHANSRPQPLTPARLDQIWSDLRANAAKVDRAIWDLAFDPRQSVPFLNERLRRVDPLEAKQAAKLLADLESTTFNVRQAAERKLIELGEAAEPALRKTLVGNPPLEMRRRIEQILDKRGPDVLRQLRAIDALAEIGTPDARQVLETLAKATPSPDVRRESEAAMKRMTSP